MVRRNFYVCCIRRFQLAIGLCVVSMALTVACPDWVAPAGLWVAAGFAGLAALSLLAALPYWVKRQAAHSRELSEHERVARAYARARVVRMANRAADEEEHRRYVEISGRWLAAWMRLLVIRWYGSQLAYRCRRH